ncbi:MAG: hypothetical protein NVSMB18_17160 [Acetobacteraceae bacterium]
MYENGPDSIPSYGAHMNDRPSDTHSGVYDPNRHDNQIVAVYDTAAEAKAARDSLVNSGTPAGQLLVLDRPVAAAVGTSSVPRDEGFMRAVMSLFATQQDAAHYQTALDRGHAILVVAPSSGTDRNQLIQMLERTHPVDLDAKIGEWTRTEPSGFPAGTATLARTIDTGTLQIMQERPRIGQREVAAGAVRIRSYVVERPVAVDHTAATGRANAPGPTGRAASRRAR